MNRRDVVLGLSALPLAAFAAESRLPTPRSLRDIALQNPKEPLILLASLPNCPYCELARRSYLIPYRSEQQLSIWQLETTDNTAPLVDFAGNKTTATLWLKANRIKVTPTVLFFNPLGQEVAARLEGIAVPDFYGAYLDQRIASARASLR